MSTPTPVTLEQRVQALEAKVEAKASGLWASIKANWAHFVTWAGIAYSLLKHL